MWRSAPMSLPRDGRAGLVLGIAEWRPLDLDHDAVESSREAERGAVVVGHREAPAPARGEPGAGEREARRREARDVALADDGAVDEEPARAAVLARSGEFERERVPSGRERP